MGRWERTEALETGDVVVLGLATHKLGRLLTKSKVAEPLRAPFSEPEGSDGQAVAHKNARAETEQTPG